MKIRIENPEGWYVFWKHNCAWCSEHTPLENKRNKEKEKKIEKKEDIQENNYQIPLKKGNSNISL